MIPYFIDTKRILVVDDFDIISISKEDQIPQINVNFFDRCDRWIATILENEWCTQTTTKAFKSFRAKRNWECNVVEKRTVLFAAILVASVAATSVFWNLPSLAEMTTLKYEVKVRRYGISPIIAAFIQDGVVVTDVIILEPYETWYNLTLSKGKYLVEVYWASSGIFWKQLEIYVAKNVAISFSD